MRICVFPLPVVVLNRFRVAFATLLLLATATTLLAGWGLASSASNLTQSAGEAVISTVEMSTTTSVASSTSASGNPNTTTASTQTVESSAVTSAAATTMAAAGVGSYGFSGALSALGATQSRGESLLGEIQGASLLVAPLAWVVLGGMWVWRGRVRSRYTEMGFGSDVFELFMKMKGGATRIKVLNTLSTPKDRLQLAEELGVDWKTVDRHVQILNRYGFVRETAAFGTVRLYEVTPMGKMLLNLFEDLERTDGPVARAVERRADDIESRES